MKHMLRQLLSRHQSPQFLRGFSLIEVLVYVSVLLIAMGAVIAVFFSLRDVLERNRVERELADAGSQVLERISREVRLADGLDLGSTLDASPGVLTLSEGATTTRFFVENGVVKIDQNGAIGSTTPESVVVTSLVFRHYTHDPGEPEAVRAEVTLAVDSPYASTTKTFYTTAVMRGTYE